MGAMISNLDWKILTLIGAILISGILSISGFIFVLIESWNGRNKLSNWRKVLVSTGIINVVQPIGFILLWGFGIEIVKNCEFCIYSFAIIPGAIFWLGMSVLNAIVFFILEGKEKTEIWWIATISYAGSFVFFVIAVILFLLIPDGIFLLPIAT